MNVEYRTSSGNFSLRAAGLIIQDNKILLARSDDYACYYTVGGRIQQNESSENAVIRECYEETGYRFAIDRLVFIQERFFSLENKDHHEVVFFYLMKKAPFELDSGMHTDQQNEHLYWIPVEESESINLVPAFLKVAIKNIPNEIMQVVTYE